MRNKMGSWGFVFGFSAAMLCWALGNSFGLGNRAFDPYPYILLNLMLSTLAGLQGAILLIAAKRADNIAAEQAHSHLTISKTSSEIIVAVNRELESNTHLTRDVHRLLSEVRDHLKKGDQSD